MIIIIIFIIFICYGMYVKQTFSYPNLHVSGEIEVIPHNIIGEPIAYDVCLKISKNDVQSCKSIDAVLKPGANVGLEPIIMKERFDDIGVDMYLTISMCECRCNGEIPIFYHNNNLESLGGLSHEAFAAPTFYELFINITSLPETQELATEELKYPKSIGHNAQRLVDSIGYTLQSVVDKVKSIIGDRDLS